MSEHRKYSQGAPRSGQRSSSSSRHTAEPARRAASRSAVSRARTASSGSGTERARSTSRQAKPRIPGVADALQSLLPRRHRRRRATRFRIDWPRFAVVIISLGVMLFGAVNLIQYFINSRATKNTNEELQAMRSAALTEESTQEPVFAEAASTPVPMVITTPEPAVEEIPSRFQTIDLTVLPELEELYAANHDLIGWVHIPGAVDLPVVYRDNSYYLDRDFYGRANKAGTLFLDEYHPFTAETQHLVIHGHNMYDGAMFGTLPLYQRLNFLQQHGIVSYSSLHRTESYAIYGVLIVPGSATDPDFFPYTGTPTFLSVNSFNRFVDTVKTRSLYDIPVDVRPSDALLTLSTCLEDDRLVLFCRRQREGETIESLEFSVSQSTRK